MVDRWYQIKELEEKVAKLEAKLEKEIEERKAMMESLKKASLNLQIQSIFS